MKGFRRLPLKQLFALLPVIFLIVGTPLMGTPPDIVEIREVLLGANDSVMALYEMRTENQGSHYFHGETLSFVLREIATGRELDRRIVSRVTYIFDFDTDEVKRSVVAVESFDLTATIQEHRLSLAIPGYERGMLEVIGWDLMLRREGRDRALLMSKETLLETFRLEEFGPPDPEFDRLLLVRTYRAYLSPWIFLELSRENEDGIEVTRIVAIPSADVYPTMEE